MEKVVDYRNIFGALLTDLSKAFHAVFDCIPYDLVIAKLEALKLIYEHQSNRKQKLKVN